MPRERIRMDGDVQDGRLAKFIRDLFDNVLGVKAPKEEWVQTWVERGQRIGDPIALFNQFILQKANIDRLAERDDTATYWPHGHFYSPVVSRAAATADWPRLAARGAPAAVDMRVDAQRALLGELARYFPAMPFTDEKVEKFRYHVANSSYAFGDALIYWSMLNHLRPARIIEIGSGYTSALALDTVEFLGLPTKCSFIDPFPALAGKVTAPLAPHHEIVPRRVQDIDLAMLDALQPNDLLFIDSSHVVKTGSDVHFEIMEMLPRVKPGVMVHFHDMFYPFEYSKNWVGERNHSWNEVYFINAFLMYNEHFRIEFFNHFVAHELAAEIRQINPEQGGRFLMNPGGGLWLRRV